MKPLLHSQGHSADRFSVGEKQHPWSIPARHFRTVTALGFLLATALLALVIVMAYRETKQQIVSSDSVIHTRDVLSAIDAYTAGMKNAQVAALDYYNNGSEQQVQVFAAAEASIHSALGRIRTMTTDNPAQHQRVDEIEPWTSQGVDLLRKVFDLRRSGKSGPKGLEGLTAEAKQITPPLVRILQAMIAEENQLLKTRSNEQAVASRRALSLEVWGGVFAVSLMLGVLWVFLRESSVRLRAEDRLARANAELEERVRDRTAELEQVNTLLRKENSERLAAEEDVRMLNAVLETRIKERTAELESANQELKAFSYSVSHDLRSPLHAVSGYSSLLLDDYGDKLDERGRHYLERVRAGVRRMTALIDDLLKLSQISRSAIQKELISLSDLARNVARELRQRDPQRKVLIEIADGLVASADPRLMTIVLENLFGNAWKFTSKRPDAKIELGAESNGHGTIFYIRDNGAGFEMKYVEKLFVPFQRLHTDSEFVGTGIGLATVQRILVHHGGKIWAEGQLDRGAKFSFTL